VCREGPTTGTSWRSDTPAAIDAETLYAAPGHLVCSISGCADSVCSTRSLGMHHSRYQQHRFARQVLKVKKVEVPAVCREGADYGDLMEIRYTSRLEGGRILDGSDIK
jgi:hypothetical protein